MADINNSLGQNTSGGGVWGSITGNLLNQLDLTTYLEENYYPLLSNPNNYATLLDIPTTVSQLINDSGYITLSDLPDFPIYNLQEVTDFLVNSDGFAETTNGIQGSKMKFANLESDGYGFWVSDNYDLVRNFEYIPYAGLFIKSDDGSFYSRIGNSAVGTGEVGVRFADLLSDRIQYFDEVNFKILDFKFPTSVVGTNKTVQWRDRGGEPAFTDEIPTLTSELTNDSGFITQDDVEEYPNLASFPPTGVVGTIYIALDTGLFYTWNGSTYVLSSAPDTGITGGGIINRLPKFTPNGVTIGSSNFSDDGLGGRYNIAGTSSYLAFYAGGNTYLRLQRASNNKMEFNLGNAGASQPAEITTNNAFGFEFISTAASAYMSFKVGLSSIEGLRLLSNGKLRFTQTPDVGTTSDSILVRDSSGNVKIIPYPTIPSLSGYVPYTGATANVDLGNYSLTANGGIFSNWTGGSFAVNPQGTAPYILFRDNREIDGEERTLNIGADVENGFSASWANQATTSQSSFSVKNQFIVESSDATDTGNLYVTPTEVSTSKKMVSVEGFVVSPFPGNAGNIFELGTNYINQNFRQINFRNYGDGIEFPTEKNISINANIEDGINFSLSDIGDSYGQFILGSSNLSINIGQSGVENSIDVSNIQTQFSKKVVTQEGFEGQYVKFDTAAGLTAGVGELVYNDQDGTLDLGLKGGNVTLQLGQEQILRVVNKTATNIDLLESNYQAVRVTGAQGNRLKVDLAQATNDLLSAETIGLVTETITNNQEGFITTSGLVRGINTTGSLQGETWADGDMLYLSPIVAGQITNIKPSAPNHLIVMGYVIRAHDTQGQIFVKVDNGYEIDELHNVKINDATNSQTLVYNSSLGVWENEDQLLVQTQKMFNTFRAGTTSLVAIGNNLGVALSNFVTRTLASTSDYTKKQRIGNVTAASAASISNYRLSTLHFVLDGLEYFEQTIGTAEGSSTSGMRAVFGIFTNIGALSGNIEYNTLTDLIGLCRLSTSNNWHIIHNDNVGTAITIDLGSSFPANIEGEIYTYRITPNGVNDLDVTVTRQSTGVSVTHNITSNIPSTSVLYTIKGGANNNTNAVAFGWDFFAITELFK